MTWVAILLAAYGAPEVISTVRVAGLNESSGLAASRAHPGVFWSHNDSGGGPYLYAFDRRGRGVGRWRVPGARANDWEDIAIGPAPKGRWYLYIGDIGDNQRRRKDITVYRILEPNPSAKAAATEAAAAIRLHYPDEPHDAESLMVHPSSGDVYVVTKARGSDAKTVVYKASPPFNLRGRNKLRRAGEVELPISAFTLLVGGATGGDIAPGGDRVVLCGYFAGWEAVLPRGAKNFDAIWKAEWRDVGLGARRQGESVAYRHDGRAILAGSEGAEFPLIEILRTE